MKRHPVLFAALLALSLAALAHPPASFAAEAETAAPVKAAETSFAGQLIPSAPEVTALAYVLMDSYSGEILAEKNGDQRLEPASLTKLMTGYVVFKAIQAGKVKLTDKVNISEKAWRTSGSRTFVKLNSQVLVDDLLKGMIVQSGNDASVALAEHVGGSEEGFATLMNRYAAELGMSGSHFTNATGLPDPELYITARDIGRTGRAIIREFPDFYKYYSIQEFTHNEITQYNRNKLLYGNAGVDGIKTGHTESAGYCLVASAKREDMRLISVVLGTKSEKIRASESLGLLNYGFRAFESHRVYATKTPLSTVRVWKGAVKELPLGVAEDLYLTVPRGQYKNLKAKLVIDPKIVAPTKRGETHGSIKITLGDKELISRPIVALQAVAAGSWWRRIIDSVLLWFN